MIEGAVLPLDVQNLYVATKGINMTKASEQNEADREEYQLFDLV